MCLLGTRKEKVDATGKRVSSVSQESGGFTVCFNTGSGEEDRCGVFV